MSRGFLSKDDRLENMVLPEKLDEIFGDFGARSNLVGLYELLLKIDQRNNPQLYGLAQPEQTEAQEND